MRLWNPLTLHWPSRTAVCDVSLVLSGPYPGSFVTDTGSFIVNTMNSKKGAWIPGLLRKQVQCNGFLLCNWFCLSLSRALCFIAIFRSWLKGIFINRTVYSAETVSSMQSNVKEKRKLALISFTVAVSYHLCYLPFLVFELYIAFQPYQAILDKVLRRFL